ncbi:pheromone A receptor-domain-containing protein [Suillus plorans]|uniref:Pheromone A receptor-domain-containing protein n=1 Tax=Suillus plorans TaxID=116603 RepID=A0A9P7IY74_9AGAM|nr:pheromone A receptor-domain-containing protein [Suillus plorans]XP_041162210.1 pheromone A receptor-domain-containing protein [Suillus plorans]KAG1796922.1 pheromone A receptor-domain-containing protein [Suillus plorans]KAG1796939.1 pheromone A receptor-domain-containing protein [Suillus plorans]
MTGLDYPLYPIFAFLGFVVTLIPLPWHLQAWNSGTCYYMIWAALSCLNQFINSIVWHNNAINWAPIWCDISIRIMLGASVGIPAASLCINRRLYNIAKTHAVALTDEAKRRAILIDTLICVLFPMIVVALQYVVQGHRFDIYEDIGCYPFIYNTLPAFFLSDSWPIIIGLVSSVYCGLSLKAFYLRRAQFTRFLKSNKSLSASRYFRLMALAMAEILCTIPLASFIIWLNSAAHPVEPWISWENVHYDFSRVMQYPSVLWTTNYLLVVAIQLTRWLVVFCAFTFFAFFGFAAEARKNYGIAFWWVAKIFGFYPARLQQRMNSNEFNRAPRVPAILPSATSFPLYVVKERKHNSPLVLSWQHSLDEQKTSPV